MMTVQDDWIQYEAVPVRRVGVRGGGACAQRSPMVHERERRSARVTRDAAAVEVRRSGTSVGVGAARPALTRLRLTRRGRLVLVVLPVLCLVVGAGIAVGAGTAQASPVPAVVRQVVVTPGESLRSTARRISPDTDPAAVVGVPQRVDSLRDDVVSAGVALRVPKGLDRP